MAATSNEIPLGVPIAWKSWPLRFALAVWCAGGIWFAFARGANHQTVAAWVGGIVAAASAIGLVVISSRPFRDTSLTFEPLGLRHRQPRGSYVLEWENLSDIKLGSGGAFVFVTRDPTRVLAMAEGTTRYKRALERAMRRNRTLLGGEFGLIPRHFGLSAVAFDTVLRRLVRN